MSVRSPGVRAARAILRWLAAAMFAIAGVNHFRNPEFYRHIVPPGFPSPAGCVIVSGICEIVGGLALLILPLRQIAGWGLIALLIAVFPANVYMALAPERFVDLHIPAWALWLRLPIQGVLIVWVWWVGISESKRGERRGAEIAEKKK